MTIGFHHLRRRARVSSGLEPFPARSLLKRLLDRLMYGVAFAAPLALAPQIYQLYASRETGGLSFATWLLLAIVNFLWTLYGLVHKDRHLIIANGLLFICHIVLITGLILYSN